MNHDQVVEQLIALMQEGDLDELRVRFGETTFELVRREAQPPAAVAYVAAPGGATGPGAAAASAATGPAGATGAGTAGAAGAAAAGAGAGAAGGGPPPGTHVVKAPLVGVFYRAPAPGAEPFVQEGTRVQPGQVLCILEAMKMMNEITADFPGTVTKIVPGNGELVPVNGELFWIAP